MESPPQSQIPEAPQGKPWTVAYKPSAWQVEFHQLAVDEALGAGSAGPGKTFCLVRDVVQRIKIEQSRCEQRPIEGWGDDVNKLIEQNPLRWGQSAGWALHLRREFKNISQTLSKAGAFFKQIDPKVKWNGKFNYFQFASGYKVQFDHCHLTANIEGFLSNDYDHIAFDQVEQFDEDMYDNIITRRRSADPVLGIMLKVRSMANPTVNTAELTVKLKNPFWVRERFVAPAAQGRVLHKRILPPGKDGERQVWSWIYIPATLYDNPDKNFVKRYEATLLNAPKHIRDALLYGNWYVVPGAYFTEVYDPRFHVCRPHAYPRHGRFFRSLDWGYMSWGCCLWWYLSEDGVLFCIREFNFKETAPDKVAKAILGIEKNMGLGDGRRSLIVGVADTQLWERRTAGSSVSAAAIMITLGVAWRPAMKGPGSRETNGRRAHEWLKGAGAGLPKLVMFDTCTKLNGLIPGVQRAKDNAEEPAAFEGDDPLDAWYYGITFASLGKSAIPRIDFTDHKPMAQPRRTEAWAERDSFEDGTSYGPGEGRQYR